MSEEQQVIQISGVAKRQRWRLWAKKPEDVRPCLHAGCAAEGFFIPYLMVWAKDDPQRLGRYVVVVLPAVLCEAHATQDPAEYRPDDVSLADLRTRLGGEPDLDTMVVQFFGNHRVKVSYAQIMASEAAGAYEKQYDNKTGKLVTRKVG